MYCNVEFYKGLELESEDYLSVEKALTYENEYRKHALLLGGRQDTNAGHIIYMTIEYNSSLDIIVCIKYFKELILSDEELLSVSGQSVDTEYRVIHLSEHHRRCKEILHESNTKRVQPITLKEANNFVTNNHRHHDSCTGCKFSIGLYVSDTKGNDKLIGVAICGRPVSRVLDNGLTLEINRLCVLEQYSYIPSCSMLYSSCVRIAKEMGYKKVITYILESESGSSLKASNFVLEDAKCGGKEWTGKRRKENIQTPKEYKQRWVKYL